MQYTRAQILPGLVTWLVLSGSLSGCSNDSSGSGGAADCPDALRTAGRVYVWDGLTEHGVISGGIADLGACDDTGNDARGVYFPAQPDQTPFVTFEGIDVMLAVGTRGEDGTVSAYLSDHATGETAERIREQLAAP